jgi:hypothetical protein
MPSIAESYDHQKPLNPPLQTGLETLSQDQEIEFTLYVKLILPLDGYVFWVRSDLVSQLMVCNCWQYSTPVPDDGSSPPGPTFCAKGSFHYSSQIKQGEDETMSLNRVVFTAQEEIKEFNAVGPCTMYIGEFDKDLVRFSFSNRASFYKQADIFHYQGDAIYPALESQIIDSLDNFDVNNVIVSNSLPIWLMLNQFMPMYPSFLVTPNLQPPYASVHVVPDSTQAIGMQPLWDIRSNHSQLVSEKVRITLYGMRNFNALDFQDYVFQYSLDNPTVLGFMNMPVMRDDKRTQSELGILAQKKVFECEINYYQTRVRNIALQYIIQCIPTVTVEPITADNILFRVVY